MAHSNWSRRRFLAAGAAMIATGALAEGLPAGLVRPAWEQTTDRKLRIGVAGGRFGLSFQWLEHPNCVVEAVTDLIPERLEQMKGRFQCDNTYPSLEEMVKDPNLDAIAVFTPVPDHAEHTLLCFEHGKHVICACPACMTLEEAEQLAEAKKRTGLRYMSAETSYYRWDTITARRLYREGAFGEMVYCEGEYFHPGIGYDQDSLSRMSGEKTWRYAFPPMLYPTHSTAFLTGVTGERIVKLSAHGLRETQDIAYQDNDYDNPFANGMVLSITDKDHPFRWIVAWNIHAHGERATWFGDKAALYMPNYAGQPFAHQVERGESLVEVPDYWPEIPPEIHGHTGHGNSHPFITHEFVSAFIEDREPVIDMAMSLDFCVPGIVAHQSCFEDGKQLEVPRFL